MLLQAPFWAQCILAQVQDLLSAGEGHQGTHSRSRPHKPICSCPDFNCSSWGGCSKLPPGPLWPHRLPAGWKLGKWRFLPIAHIVLSQVHIPSRCGPKWLGWMGRNCGPLNIILLHQYIYLLSASAQPPNSCEWVLLSPDFITIK